MSKSIFLIHLTITLAVAEKSVDYIHTLISLESGTLCINQGHVNYTCGVVEGAAGVVDLGADAYPEIAPVFRVFPAC